MGYTDDFNTDDQTVAVPRIGWMPLKAVYEGVRNGTLSPDDLPEYPVAGKGWFRADKAWEVISQAQPQP